MIMLYSNVFYGMDSTESEFLLKQNKQIRTKHGSDVKYCRNLTLKKAYWDFDLVNPIHLKC